MNYFELIQNACNRPAMHVQPPTLETLFAFIDGLDVASGCLTGFREWLVVRFEEGDNLHWTGLVLEQFKQEQCPPDKQIVRLGELIEEFRQFISDRQGLTRVYVRYHAWLLTRPWYEQDFSGYIPPYDGVNIN